MSDAAVVVAVTGANGFLASHIVDQLLAAGHVVRATVRNLRDTTKVAHLHELARKHNAVARFALFDADLMRPGSFDEAFRGARVVIHSAMPVTMTARDPQRSIVDPALEGVVHVIDSVERNAATIEQLVFTSSTECVGPSHAAAAKGVSEETWNTEVSIANAYTYAKVLAERKAVALFEERSALRRVKLLCLLPSWIAGPLLNPNAPPPVSLEAFIGLTNGEYPCYPNLFVQVVDVRDVALAHVRAVTFRSDKRVERIAVASPVVWSFGDMCAVLRRTHGHLRVASFTAPDWMLYLATLWDARLSFGFLQDNLNVPHRVDSTKSIELLSVRYRSAEETARASMDSLVAYGMLKPKLPKLVLLLGAAALIIVLLVWLMLR